MKNEWIKIKNATQNNLKNVSTQIPKHRITVVTGLSGSGKSSLIFDTLAAESRRELNDTFPSFLQKYLPKYGRPFVENIENLPVAIVIEQKKLSSNSRSTVGTYTDLYTFLRLLFSRVGKPFVGYSDTFSFNHPEGKCPECDGIGSVTKVDIHKLVDINQSLNEGPIDFPTFQVGFWRWKRYADSGLFDLDKKIRDYTKEELNLLYYAPQQKLKHAPEEWPRTALYEGLIPRFKRSIIQSDEGKRHQKQLEGFVTVGTCPVCQGSRVNERVRSCRIADKSIADVVELSLNQLYSFIEEITDPLAVDLKPEILKRVQALIEIGLSYLTLARSTGSLSGGEAQRIRISKYINSALNDMMYILDEPSAGLHPKDIDRINQALLSLKNKGNTVVLVEHNPQLIAKADYILEMGPGAGESGGMLQFAGEYQDFLQADTLTSRALKVDISVNKKPRQSKEGLKIERASLHNLSNFSVTIPLGVMTVICGVAGSGKSSLGNLIQKTAIENQQEIVAISQKSIGINLRSTPLTYLDIFGKIREQFAKTNQVSSALFSYNSKGACPTCRGKGVIISDMAFMEDIVTTCEVCHGTRYDPSILHYTYKGQSIVDVLNMTVNESYQFFADQPFRKELQTLVEVGLGYLCLNQSLTTLSGGELQRLKLANQLHKKGAIYLLDEPTDGLHLTDINNLLKLFNEMVEGGSSLILLEHHLSILKQADWIIEMGPEGGQNGGKLIFEGTPQELAASDDQITRPYL